MNFLLVDSNPVILLDLVGMLRARWPGSLIETSSTLSQARAVAESLSDISVAMIGLPPRELNITDLPNVIQKKNGTIIVPYFGDETAREDIMARGWVPLALPFTNETLQDAFTTAGLALR